MLLTFLGTGTSHGVPSLDCMLNDFKCPSGVCQKALTDASYRRTRASVLLQTPDFSLLIDTSQDFRQQMLANQVKRIDAVLFTHGHADHIYGLPDIRSYCRHERQDIDVYGSPETLAILKASFGYIFNPPPDYVGGGIPALWCRELVAPKRIGGVLVTPIPVEHGNFAGVQGYRLDNIAYLPDVKSIPPNSLDLLGGLDLLVLNCLRHRPHGSHLALTESVAFARQLRPRQCLLTHMAHDIDYRIEEERLPKWIRFAYDGQTIQV